MPATFPMFALALTIGLADPFAPPPAPVEVTAGIAAAVTGGPVTVLGGFADEPLPGVTRPEREATLSVSSDGLIASIRVGEGAAVRAGHTIAVLDDRVAREAVRVSEEEASHDAAVVRARAELERAAESLSRAEAAHAAGAMNDERLSEARNRRDVAAADLEHAEEMRGKAAAQLALTRAQLEQHRICAPFDGVVVRVHAEEGEALSPGEPLVELVALERTLADLYLPAERAMTLRPGERVALELESPIGAVVPARVRYAEPRVDPTSRATRVVFVIESGPFAVPAGVLVRPAVRAPGRVDVDRLAQLEAYRTPVEGAATAAADGADEADEADGVVAAAEAE